MKKKIYKYIIGFTIFAIVAWYAFRIILLYLIAYYFLTPEIKLQNIKFGTSTDTLTFTQEAIGSPDFVYLTIDLKDNQTNKTSFLRKYNFVGFPEYYFVKEDSLFLSFKYTPIVDTTIQNKKINIIDVKKADEFEKYKDLWKKFPEGKIIKAW